MSLNSTLSPLVPGWVCSSRYRARFSTELWLARPHRGSEGPGGASGGAAGGEWGAPRQRPGPFELLLDLLLCLSDPGPRAGSGSDEGIHLLLLQVMPSCRVGD